MALRAAQRFFQECQKASVQMPVLLAVFPEIPHGVRNDCQGINAGHSWEFWDEGGAGRGRKMA